MVVQWKIVDVDSELGRCCIFISLLVPNISFHLVFCRFDSLILNFKVLLDSLNESSNLGSVLKVDIMNFHIIDHVALWLIRIGLIRISIHLELVLWRISAWHEQILLFQLLAMVAEIIVLVRCSLIILEQVLQLCWFPHWLFAIVLTFWVILQAHFWNLTECTASLSPLERNRILILNQVRCLNFLYLTLAPGLVLLRIIWLNIVILAATCEDIIS